MLDRRSTSPETRRGLYYGEMASTDPPAEPDIGEMGAAAHHEAGHLVVAAAEGLKMRPDGLCVDSAGNGLACYWKWPEPNDESRSQVVTATYGGALAEERLRRERGLVLRPGRWNLWNDGSIAAEIIRTMVENGSSGEADPRIVARLESRSESLVNRHWNTITTLAKTLLEQEWAAPTKLHTGEIWTYEAKAKQTNGNAVAAFLTQMGIPSKCDWMRSPE